MSASTKLSNAVKAICFLSDVKNLPKTSAEISEATGVNASKLRMLLSKLVKNNIVESSKGTSGGFILKKKPKEIHLQEIYCAIEDRKAFHLDVTQTLDEKDKVIKSYNKYFLNLFADIQVDIENKMQKITIADVLKNL